MYVCTYVAAPVQPDVKKCEVNQKQGYKQPKHLIPRKAKKTKLYYQNRVRNVKNQLKVTNALTIQLS